MPSSSGPSAEPQDRPDASPVPVVPYRTVDCWSCDAPNTTSRMFCASCGSFIAIGSRTKAAPSALPFSGPPPVPGDADVDVSLPFVEGVSPLGSYSVEAQRRATRRTRTMTATVSVVMAMVVGAAALYLASPLSDRGDVPQTAAVVAPPLGPEPTDPTTAVSGISIEPPAVVIEPGPVLAAPDPVAVEPKPEPVVEPEPVVIEPEPVAVEPKPAVVEPIVVEPEPVAVVQEEPEVATEALGTEATGSEQERAGYNGGWVCEGEIVLEDSRVRNWSVGRVSFRPRDGFDRVVFHLDRADRGSGDPANITADSIGSWKIKENVPGADRPGLGRRSVTLQLDDGFAGSLALRGYRPAGLATIKEFSVYPAGRDGRVAVISGDTDGCFRVRAPGWNDPSASVRRAEIHVDIKP